MKSIRWQLTTTKRNAWEFAETGRSARVSKLSSTRDDDVVEFSFGGETMVRKVSAAAFVRDFRRIP